MVTIQKINDTSSKIEILAMNIDDEYNILIKQDGELGLLKVNDFKEMLFGTKPDEKKTDLIIKEATYKLVEL